MTSTMHDEIHDVPACIARLLHEGADAAADAAAAISAARPAWVSIVGRGTSDHAAVYARYLFEAQLGWPSGLAAPSITSVYGATVEWRGGLVLAVSQSGESPDVVAVVAEARAAGAVTVAVTNEPASPLAGAAEHVLACHAGVERSVAATKTYVAELVVLADLVARLSPVPLLGASVARLPDVLGRCLEVADRWIDSSEVVDAVAGSDRALVLSRGYNLATALEVALKLTETSGLWAAAYSTADVEHGPVVVARSGVPVLAFRPDGEMGRRVDQTVGRVAALGATPWLVGGYDLEPSRRAGVVAGIQRLALPLDLPEPLTPAALVLPGQLLAAAVAHRRGVDPDAPPGLQKVTLTL